MPHLPADGLSNVLCHICAHGPVCVGQRGGGCSDETSRGEQQGTVTRVVEQRYILFIVIIHF